MMYIHVVINLVSKQCHLAALQSPMSDAVHLEDLVLSSLP